MRSLLYSLVTGNTGPEMAANTRRQKMITRTRMLVLTGVVASALLAVLLMISRDESRGFAAAAASEASPATDGRDLRVMSDHKAKSRNFCSARELA